MKIGDTVDLHVLCETNLKTTNGCAVSWSSEFWTAVKEMREANGPKNTMCYGKNVPPMDINGAKKI